MKEYKVISEGASTIQKWLNQWRHDYEIKILAITTLSDLDYENGVRVTVVLTRERQNEAAEDPMIQHVRLFHTTDP